MADESWLVEADSLRANEAVVLVNNTIADNDGAAAVLSLGEGQGGDVSLLRNLVIAGSDGLSALEFETPPDSLTVSMNAGSGVVRWTPPETEPAQALIGPNLAVEDLTFEEPEALRGLPPCGRHLAVCPEATTADCDVPGGRLYECAPDLAASYVPTAATSAMLEASWPWQTEYFAGVDVAVPGASGWRCWGIRGTWDQWEGYGDGDGYPEAVDCDNEDANTIPALPEHDGYSSTWCDATEIDCYTCPAASLPPPDSSGDDDSVYPTLGDCSGCGFAWSCEDSGLLVVLPAMGGLTFLRRRKDPRRR